MKILICDKVSEKGIEILQQDPENEVDVKLKLSEDEICEIIPQYHAVVVRSQTKITEKILEEAKQLKVVGRAGVGIDNIDVETATLKGIVVVNTPDGNTISAAEHTMAMMLALARHIPQADQSLREGKWNRSQFVGVELRNKTLGVIGFGKIGSEVGKRSQAFGMKILVYDPYVNQEVAERAGVKAVSLDTLLQESDFITVHMPLTSETKHLLCAQQFAKMKEGVRILNVARGGIIDEAALYEAIMNKKVAGAALDVYEKEPQTESPLFALPEVIVTPHLGASTAEAQVNVAIDVAREILRV
ncbi:MAG TPA: phosphoglycerate dehydrogenase, partial [Clostridia bacterium]|nr:phosphoglycerate dehydrogenase [Clostridia bacterium]